jgi:hypothetical protein
VFAHDLATPLWNIRAAFNSEILEPYRKDPAGNSRLLAHLVLGASIIVLAMVLAPAAKFAARSRVLIGLLGLILLAAVIGQIWIGILLLYDTDSGPLGHFNAASGDGSGASVSAGQN